jgi:hypothetical protein
MATIRIDFLDCGKYYKILKRKKKTDSILTVIDNAKWFEGKLIEDEDSKIIFRFTI